MTRKSALLKVFTALPVALLAVSSWAQGGNSIAEEQESSKLYCVKKVDDDGDIYVHLSQKGGSYTPEQDEQCFATWYSSDGGPCAHTALDEIVTSNRDNLIEVVLASDINFGGYNDMTGLCNEEFYPMDFDVSDPVRMVSQGSSRFTISGLCYKAASGPASFGGSLIASFENVNFKNIHLESPETAGLAGSLYIAAASNVVVENVIIRAPIAGLLAGSAETVNAYNLIGNSVSIYSLPYIAGAESPNLSYVMLGGLVGNASEVTATAVKIDLLTVSNHPEVDSDLYEPMSSTINSSVAYVGGVCGALSDFATLEHIGFEYATVADHSDGQSPSYLGGLIGSMHGQRLSVENTFTTGDILCSKELCVAGFGAGEIAFENDVPDVSVSRNYHYTHSDADVAIGFGGIVVAPYMKDYEGMAAAAPDTNITDDFNTKGTIPYYTDGNTGYDRSDKTVARANYRNALGSVMTTDGFNAETYEFETDQGTLPNGILDSVYMATASFADYLNGLSGVRLFGEPDWQFDSNHDTPYLYFPEDFSGNQGGGSYGNIQVFFMVSCMESGCLTDDEIEELAQFSEYRMNYEFMLPVDADGHIDSEWEKFAKSLTGTKKNRDPVCWEQSYETQPFAIGNTYSDYTSYNLIPCDGEEKSSEKGLVFFGKGVDYAKTSVLLRSYFKDEQSGALDEVGMATYEGEDGPVQLDIGELVEVYTSSTPKTTDGSKFKSWKMKVAVVSPSDEKEMRDKAAAGIPIPVDKNGYFNLGARENELKEAYEQLFSSGNIQEIQAEIQKVNSEMQTKAMSGKLGEDEINGYMDRLDSLNALVSAMSTDNPDAIMAVLIYPEGFEAENNIVDTDESEELKWDADSIKVELAYPALLQSGNAVQLNVKTDKFTYDEETPFVIVTIEKDGVFGGDTAIRYEDGEWPEMLLWEKYPLEPGSYLLSANIFDGKKMTSREWNFEVKGQIADECGSCWYMVSLSNVDLDKIELSEDNQLYWWNEWSKLGKYWQYEEVSKVSNIDRTRGYWYNSMSGTPLELNGEALEDETLFWEIDSVYSGWNMVRNPYGWYIGVSSLADDGYAFFRWDSKHSKYVRPRYIKPYESIWIKAKRETLIELSAKPAFVDMVDDDGNTVAYRSLTKTQTLAKAAAADEWNLQMALFDANGKSDTWNELGVGSEAGDIEDPPAGMGDLVNLTILDAGRRLMKSVKASSADAVYEWHAELSASSDRMGYVVVSGADALLSYGLHVYMTVDGKTVEVHDGDKVPVNLSSKASVAEIRVAPSAKKVVAYTLQGLRVTSQSNALQVSFEASNGLNGAKSRVDVVDLRGSVVATANFKAVEGTNMLSLDIPRRGLYAVRVAVGKQVAVQKVLLK